MKFTAASPAHLQEMNTRYTAPDENFNKRQDKIGGNNTCVTRFRLNYIFSFYCLLKIITSALVFFCLCLLSSIKGTIDDNIVELNNDIKMQVHSASIMNGTIAAQHKCAVPQSNISIIFLHVGPGKTGSTTFQNYFACESNFLKEHNTYFLGKVNPRDVRKCIDVPQDFVRGIVQYKSIKDMKRLKNKIEAHVSLKNNIILSAEEFSKSDNNNLIEILFRTMNKTLEYNVIPVVAYRWYHDWIKSLYYYFYTPTKHVAFWNTWDIDYVVPYPDNMLKSVQNDTHPSIPTFRNYWKRFQNETHPSIQQINTFPDLVARARDSNNRPCVRVLNMHSGLIGEFASLVKGNKSNSSSLMSKVEYQVKPFSVDSEILALKLKKDGLVHEKFSRRKVVTMLQKKMEFLYGNITSIKVPLLDCLSQPEEQELLSMTVQSDQILLNLGLVDAPLVGQETLLQNFQKNIANKIYCNILLEEMIKEGAWKLFITCLKDGIDCP